MNLLTFYQVGFKIELIRMGIGGGGQCLSGREAGRWVALVQGMYICKEIESSNKGLKPKPLSLSVYGHQATLKVQARHIWGIGKDKAENVLRLHISDPLSLCLRINTSVQKLGVKSSNNTTVAFHS